MPHQNELSSFSSVKLHAVRVTRSMKATKHREHAAARTLWQQVPTKFRFTRFLFSIRTKRASFLATVRTFDARR